MTEPNEKDFLAIQKEFSSIQQMYTEDATQNSFNVLLCGEMGAGKTHCASTGRRPIHWDSFDPGGTKISPVLQGIREGYILVDTRFEHEDPMSPTVGALWAKEMERRTRLGYFNHIGTYVIDSHTQWVDALMNQQLKSAGIAGQAPRFTHDYNPVKVKIRNYIREIMKLPCDFILIGHLDSEKDGVDGRIVKRFGTIGKGSAFLPTLFDEVYVALTKDSPSGTVYSLLTSPKDNYLARTRMGSMKFAREETPDLRSLMKKAGRSINDLPYTKPNKE